MPGVIKAQSAATCGHTATGSSNVFVNGQGASRVGLDLGGGGVILGPGILSVRVNGFPISVIGDAVTPHGNSVHAAPTTANPSPDVFAGG